MEWNNSSFLFSFIFACFITLTLTSDSKNYKISYLNSHSGLYYNHLGVAGISTSKFTLLSHFNLSTIYQNYEQLTTLHLKSSNICSHKHTSNSHNHVIFYCQNSLGLLEARLTKLKEKIETVNHIIGHNLNYPNRVKREIFDGVSYVINWLFGIPDANDAKFYEDSIKSLLHENQQTQLFMKRQIGIVSNTISNFNNSIQILKINEDKLNANIELFNTFSQQTTSSINELKMQQIIYEQINLLSQMLTEIDDFYNILISSITLAKHNILYPQIISPLNLLNELTKLMLPSGHQLPIPLSYDTIYKFFEICQLKVVYINQIVIFAIKIPLIKDLQYDLYQMLPLPIPHNSSYLYSFIEPSSPYLMMSTTKGYYSLLQNLEKCTTILPATYLCQHILPKQTNEKPVCETTLLTSIISKIPSNCNTKSIQAELEIWNSIQNNQWIFSITNSIQLALACKGSPIEDIKLASTGILQLREDCKAYTSTHILETTSETTTTLLHKIPNFNIANDECCVQKSINITNQPMHLSPIKLVNANLEELQLVNHKLNQLNMEITKQLNQPLKFHSNTSWYSTILSLLGSFIGLVILYKVTKWCGLLHLLRKILCSTRSPKLHHSGCCAKIFNTNISGVPVTREQLSKMIEEEEDFESNERVILMPLTSRKSIARAPSINMD